MKHYSLILFVVLFTTFSSSLRAQEKKSYDLATVGFYNLENLFDTIVDPDPNKILQDEFTPKGKSMWNTKRYLTKIEHMSRIISQLGSEVTKTAPMVVGVSEVENEAVIQDLINHPNLKKYNYGIVHYESPDRRGIDVALIYRKDFVKILDSQSRRLYYSKKPNFRTRDQLVVHAEIDGEPIYFQVNHWPSRRGGEKRSSPLREAAAALAKSIADSINQITPNAKIIIMGDLNDDPTNKSIKKVLGTSADKDNIAKGQFYNPMENKYKKGNGTGAWGDTWNLFDNLIVSKSLVESDTKNWKFYKAKIYKSPKLIQQSGRFKGYPYRTFAGGEWLGGYSDHFPVYLYLIKEK